VFSRSACWFANGATARTIAIDLNRRGIPGPRSRHGWRATGIRYLLKNVRYRGEVVWNRLHWQKDPDSGIHRSSVRDRS
jgi:hypothetical protein